MEFLDWVALVAVVLVILAVVALVVLAKVLVWALAHGGVKLLLIHALPFVFGRLRQRLGQRVFPILTRTLKMLLNVRLR